MKSRQDLAERKALLIIRSDLERLRLRLAIDSLRSSVTPLVTGSASTPVKVLWRLLGYAAPTASVLNRLGGAVRLAAIGMVAYRAVRSWRERRSK